MLATTLWREKSPKENRLTWKLGKIDDDREWKRPEGRTDMDRSNISSIGHRCFFCKDQSIIFFSKNKEKKIRFTQNRLHFHDLKAYCWKSLVIENFWILLQLGFLRQSGYNYINLAFPLTFKSDDFAIKVSIIPVVRPGNYQNF